MIQSSIFVVTHIISYVSLGLLVFLLHTVAVTDAVAAGRCECSVSSSLNAEDCTKCKRPSQCTKTCTAVVPGSEPPRTESYPCKWIKPTEKCSACSTRSGYVMVVQCPSSAPVGQCTASTCVQVKIGYSGPVTGPGADQSKIKTRKCRK
ncbi:hypothetical protein OAO01_01440 [Oligoflexia bacterium]|nr:hypothetical protein [Oligoflexia bacterium]